MKRFILVLFVLVVSTALLSIPLYSYKLSGVVVFRSLGIKIKPFFEYDEVEVKDYFLFEPELITVREGRKKLILIHGIAPKEVDEKLGFYKKSMIDSFKEIMPDDVGIYFFLYPSLSVDLQYSSKKLIELTDSFKEIYVYAHSMGGILLRYALQDKEFSRKVKMAIFAGTPHVGSPLAQLIFLKTSILNFFTTPKVELIKRALLLANFFNGYILAPNYKYLIFGKKFPPIPDYVKRVNFVGKLEVSVESIDDILKSNPIYFTGLYFLKYIVDNIYPEGSIFLENDGMVPVFSATQDSDINFIFYGANHADLAMRRDIIEKAAEFFGFIGEGV